MHSPIESKELDANRMEKIWKDGLRTVEARGRYDKRWNLESSRYSQTGCWRLGE